MMPIEAGRIERGGLGTIQEIGHQLRHTAGDELAVPFARDDHVAVVHESARETFGIGGGRHRVRLSRQEQRRHRARQGRVQVGIDRPLGQSLQMSVSASS
jgi:hypothetical protein